MSTETKSDEMNSYFEKVWNHFLIIAAILIEGLLVTVAITTSISDPTSMTITIAICSSVGLLFLFILFNYSNLQIIITETEVYVKYGLFNKKTIQIDELVSYEATSAPFKTYLGFGVRIGTDGSLAFTTRFGKAIRFEAENARPLVVSTNNPKGIIAFIDDIKSK